MTLDEFLMVNRQHRRRNRRATMMLLIIGIMGLVMVAAGIVEIVNRGVDFATVYLLAMGGFLWLLIANRLRAVAKAFETFPDRNSEFRYQIDPDRLIVETAGSRTETAWFRIAKYVRSNKGFLLYPQPSQFYWLPFHGFADPADIERCDQLLASQVNQNPFQRRP
jgi:hypothetical protein